MADRLESWARPHYQGPAGRPFLFFVAYGQFDLARDLDARRYRSAGIHPGLSLQRFRRAEHPDVLAGFEHGLLWSLLVRQDPELARQIEGSSECLILRGELDDRADLDYLRDSIGLLT